MSKRERGLSFVERLRRTVIGKPIATASAQHERVGPLLGVPLFASDNVSSVAYATEAILSILVLASPLAAPLKFQIWISLSIVVLIAFVTLSYRQTIEAYPMGGGSYIVASDNLGKWPGLAAGAALLLDYVLTVSVSVAAGVAAIVSAYQNLHSYLVPLSLAFIALLAWANLRGIKESGRAFALPTYAFIVGIAMMLVFGISKAIGMPETEQVVRASSGKASLIGAESQVFLWLLVLRAFAAGCAALTGIEAVSNGVQAFKPPEAKNANKTLAIMASILIMFFLGIGYLAQHLPEITLHSARNPEYRTVLSQIAAWVFGNQTIPFLFIQFATTMVLILAANTAFAGFPMLVSMIARDGYLPRPLARLGDRLVFHNGILILAIAAAGLVVAFHGELDQLLPLYAVGVFTAFTLSQYGMVRRWIRTKETGWRRSAVINGIGGTMTAIVTLIVLVTKFSEGAWIVAVLMPLEIFVFNAIKNRYDSISSQLEIVGDPPKMPTAHTTLLLVPRVHRGILGALEYALLTGLDCKAVHVVISKRALPTVREQWERYGEGVPLVVLPSPYRSLIRPVLDYVDELLAENPDQIVTVIVPEAVASRWYHKFLQENVANQLKAALGSRKNVVVTNVRYFLD